MLRRTTKAAIFDRREYEAKAEVLGEQRHRLVHRIRRLILRRRGRDNPAIVEYWEEDTKFDHVPLLSRHSPGQCLSQYVEQFLPLEYPSFEIPLVIGAKTIVLMPYDDYLSIDECDRCCTRSHKK